MSEFFKTSEMTREELEAAWADVGEELLRTAEENAYLQMIAEHLRREIASKDKLIQLLKKQKT